MDSRRPLRLLAFTDATGFGGAEICLGYALAELDGRHAVAVAGVDADAVAAIAAHRPGTATTVLPAGDLGAHVRAVRAWRPHVVHVNRAHLMAGGTATVAGLLVPGVAVVAVEHLPHPVAAGRRDLWRQRAINSRLAAQVSVGVRAARLAEAAMGQRVGSIEGLPNGVPPEQPEPLPRPADGVLIGGVGRFTEQKAFDVLVRALPALPDARVVLVGDGPLRGELEALAARLGAADRLLITGWTPEARRWLTALDLFALPSGWEGLPLVVLEAMHAGLPVVATDVGSVAEAVRDGETGFVVPVGDEPAFAERLARLVADPDLRARQGAAGRALAVREFTAAAMAARYEELYARVRST